MKLPRRGEKGFTLVELLIVLAILSVLAAVVIPNITGMMGRGAEQSFNTDQKTVQTAVATVYFDVHKGVGSDDLWGGTDAKDGHWYPTVDATSFKDFSVDLENPTMIDDRWEVYPVVIPTDGDISQATIWMGFLVNSTADGACDTDPGKAHPQLLEKGPYLNEFPQSCSHYGADTPWGNGNPEEPGGTYTWILCEDGKVWGASYIEGVWYAGFNGSYP